MHLAELDRLHGTLSGPATRKLAERAFQVFGEARYERLANQNIRITRALQNRQKASFCLVGTRRNGADGLVLLGSCGALVSLF